MIPVQSHTQGESFGAKCYVVKHEVNLLGCEWLRQCSKIWSRLQGDNVISPMDTSRGRLNSAQDITKELKAEFPKVFGRGRCTGSQAKLRLKDGLNPEFRRSRLVPYGTSPQLEAEHTTLLKGRNREEPEKQTADTQDWRRVFVFRPQERVLMKMCSGGKKTNWIPGVICERVGRVMYRVMAQERVWTRHVNQLKRRDKASDNDSAKADDLSWWSRSSHPPEALTFLMRGRCSGCLAT